MYIVFDIGGTKTRIAASTDLKNFSEPKIFPTPKNFSDGLKIFSATARELIGGEKIKSLAGGIAGPVEPATGRLLHATNLPDWTNQPVAKILEQEFSAHAFVYNDTALVGLGEACRGAGRDKNIVAYITVSTGVGGARIVNQKLDQTTLGFEPGHQIIDFSAALNQKTEHRGHLDDFISGAAFTKRFGRSAYEVTDEKIWRETSKIFAVGLYNTILHWSPEVVVLGGSMFKSPGILLPAVEDELRSLMKVFPVLPEIRPAELGDLGGLHGALAVLKEKTNFKI